MSKAVPDKTITNLLAAGVVAIVMIMPFHALLTVWLSQMLGYYTALRLWKEGLLALLALGVLYVLTRDAKRRRQFIHSRLAWLMAAYLAVQTVWGIAAYVTHHVSAKALGYGWISNTRFLIFFLVVGIIATYAAKLKKVWPTIVIGPLTIVVVFGLLQYFILPYDFMTHLGYSATTIFPYEDINHNVHYIRIMSTLRGANPLGAYLLVGLCLVLALWRKQHKWVYGVIAGAGVLALTLSFSRAAWAGFALSVAVLLWASLKRSPVLNFVAVGTVSCAVLAAGTGLALRHNATFQNIFFHTQEHSAVQTTSDQGHASALQSGLHDAWREPLGRGPGTAGPASVYNTGHPTRIAENYFVQIAQETGWIGLALFGALSFWVAQMLWRRRDQALALGLLAALVGVSFVNFLSHAWADDTLAYLWWGLAGIALTPAILQTKAEQADDLEETHQS
jgi:hypothetical protein